MTSSKRARQEVASVSTTPATSGRRATDRGPTSTHRALATWTVLLTATIVLKGTVLGQLHDHPLLQPHGALDTSYYLDLARTLAAGGPRALGEPLFVSPLYLYFLAAVFALGGGVLAAKVVQIGLGTAAVGLVYATARLWFGDRAALVAATLAMLTGLFTFYEVLILQAALDPFLVAVLLYAVSQAVARGRLRWIAAAGAAGGLLGLNRPNALVYAGLLPLLLAVHVWRRGSPGAVAAGGGPEGAPPRARAAGWAAAACLAGLVPVLALNGLVNYLASGEVLLVASHGGLNFYIGNHENATGTYVPVPGIDASIAGQARDALRVAETATGRRLSHAEVSRYFYGQAWAWIARHPTDALRLFGRKLLILLNAVNVPLNYSYAYYSRDEPTLLRWLLAGPWLLIPLGLVGLLRSSPGRERAGWWVWAAFVPVYALAVAAFFVSDRYRMPMLIPLSVTAGAAMVNLLEQARARRFGSLAPRLVAVAGLAAVAHWNLGLDDGRGGEQTRQALWLIEQGRYQDARRYVARIASAHSHPGVLHFRVGRALASAGRFDEAIEHLQAALVIDRQPAIHLELGQVLVTAQRSREAVAHLEAAMAAGYHREIAAPWLVRALVLSGERDRAAALLASLPDEVGRNRWESAVDLGTLALELGRAVEAERWLQLAVLQVPDRAEVQEHLGVARLLAGRPQEAVGPLELACRLDPRRASAQLNLAVAYAAVGRLSEAQVRAREAARLDPQEPRARALLATVSARLAASRPVRPRPR